LAEEPHKTPHAKPAVAQERVDFGPYLDNIQAKIKKNWQPPERKNPTRTRLLFKVHRNGDISGIRIENSSGVAAVDKAAIDALTATSPADPLPAGSPSYVDISYVFDQNMYGQESPRRSVPKELVAIQVAKARALVKQNKLSEALAQLFVVSGSPDPEITSALVAIAQRAQTSDFKTGTKIILQTITTDPQNLHLHKALATAFDLARKDYRSAETHKELAETFDREGDPDSALAAYQEAYRISGDPKFADIVLQTNSTKQPQNMFEQWQSLMTAGASTANHLGLGYAYEMCRDYDAAEQEYRKALQLDPQSGIVKARLAALPDKSKRVSTPKRAHSELSSTAKSKFPATRLAMLNNEGVRFLYKNQFGAAIQRLEIALHLDPTYSFARDNLAIAYNNYALTCPPRKAIKFFHRAAFIDPNNKTTKENLEKVLMALGVNPTDARVRLKVAQEAEQENDYMAAVVEYRAALALKNDPETQARLKAALKMTEVRLVPLSDKLQVSVEETAKRSGVTISARQQSSRLNNDGVALMDKEQFAAAIKAFETALSMDPTNEYAHVNLGIAYNNYGLKAQPKEAVKLFHKGLFEEPSSKVMEANLQNVLRRLGLKPDQANVRLKLGEAAEQEKDYKTAVVEYRAALALNGNLNIQDKLNAALKLTEAKPKVTAK